MLEEALTERQLLAEIKATISDTSLSAPKKKQLTQALVFLEAKDYDLAGPLLINPLEEAFWKS